MAQAERPGLGMLLAEDAEGAVLWPADMPLAEALVVDQAPPDQRAQGRWQSFQYQGFWITPHTFALDEGRWSIGVLLRTEHQEPDNNRYFRVRGAYAKSEHEALKLGSAFGKQLIDRELISVVNELLRRKETEITFRRERTQSTWHSTADCSFWPVENYEEHLGQPAGPLCNECRSRRNVI